MTVVRLMVLHIMIQELIVLYSKSDVAFFFVGNV